MIKTTDTLIHLPNVNAGPWKRPRWCYERRVDFNCDHGFRRRSLLKIYANDDGVRIVAVKIDGVTHTMMVGEHANPFSIAHETLLALAGNCNCRTEQDEE